VLVAFKKFDYGYLASQGPNAMVSHYNNLWLKRVTTALILRCVAPTLQVHGFKHTPQFRATTSTLTQLHSYSAPLSQCPHSKE
jgi:hypothetical protein